VVSVTVTLSTTAETPVDGTPPTPVTCRVRVVFAPSFGPVTRVSSRREGGSVANPPTAMFNVEAAVTVTLPGVVMAVPSMVATAPVPSAALAASL
jgi:hypothetical protein